MQVEDNIELRSEKARSLIGKMPPYITRYGTLVLCVAILISCVVLSIIKISDYESCEVDIISNPESFKYYSGGDTYIVHSCKQDQLVAKDDIVCIAYNTLNRDTIFVHSPFEGVVDYYISDNGLSAKNQLVVSVLPSYIEAIYAVAKVPEKAISSILEGQEVIVYIQDSAYSIKTTVSAIIDLGDDSLVFMEFEDIRTAILDAVDMKGRVSFLLSKESIFKKISSRLFSRKR